MPLALFCFSASWPDQPLHAQGGTQPLWTRDSLRSAILGEDRFLRVSLPAFYDAPFTAPDRFPVLIVLDAQSNLAFTAIVAAVRMLSEGVRTPAMPPLIVVGVETPNPTRFRDFTPPPVGTFVPSPGFPAPGGAEAFLRFLTEELRPYIASRYRAQSTTILAGHSLGGSFAAWAYGHAPGMAGVIALSPTPGWVIEDSLGGRQVVDGIAARPAAGRLFVANGTAEQYLGAGVRTFAAALRARNVPGLTFQYEQLPDLAHGLVQYLGMVPGLQFIFRPVSLSGFQPEFEDGEDVLAKFSAIYDSTRAAYLRGAQQLGMEPRLPGNFLDRAREMTYPPLAPLQLRLCQDRSTWYPTLWIGYDCAGDALARLGRLAEARASYLRGSEVARAASDSATAERLRRKAEVLISLDEIVPGCTELEGGCRPLLRYPRSNLVADSMKRPPPVSLRRSGGWGLG